MWIPRFYESQKDFLQSGKVNLVYGPRRSGKTTLIVKMLDNLSGKIYKGSGDDILLRSVLSSENTSRILSAMRNYDVIFIDEAQRIKNMGGGLKYG
ncbi:MAG: AAA family ATPase [Saprospiraceae bacterium]|nr:AAA family ATPase [Saprospiraceae bacterium]